MRRGTAHESKDRTGLQMNPMEKAGWSPLPHSDEDLERARKAPDTPQTRAPTYRLAWTDEEFMTRRELRAVRLQLELLKPEMILAERGIRSTVVMFGGARIPEPGGEAWAAKDERQKKNLEAKQQILRGGAAVCPALLAAVGGVLLPRICGCDRRRARRNGGR